MATTTAFDAPFHLGPRNTKDDVTHTHELTTFRFSRFLKDAEELCKTIEAPFSATTTEAVLKAYHDHFRNAPVGWRVTSKDSALNYRFLQGRSPDVVETAIQAGFIKRSSLTDLAQAWSQLFGGEVQQWCDFDTWKGITKTWLFLGQTRAIEEVIDVDFVPHSIRRHLDDFRAHGLDRVRTVAVDWHSKTVNLYWRVAGPLSKGQADELLGLAGCESPSKMEVEEMSRCSRAKDGSFAFALTMDVDSGKISRAAVYATKLSRQQLPSLHGKVAKFLANAPDYDPEEWITIGWGFVKDGKRYMKAEKSYCGKFMEKVRVMMTQDPNI